MWFKKHWHRLAVPAVTLAILAFAFWYGADAPGTRGWTVGGSVPAGASSSAQVQSSSAEQDGDGSSKATGQADSQKAPQNTPEHDLEKNPTPSGSPAPGASATPGGESAPAENPSTNPVPAAQPDDDGTDPIPEGKPQPVEPEDADQGSEAYTCTLSISCPTILDHLDYLDDAKVELIPEDGWILAPMEVTFYEGESVFNILQRVCKQEKIHLEFSFTPLYNSAYLEGIGNLYEFDVGSLSGWMYQVNGWFPNYGCSRYQPEQGDTIRWEYTCDYGDDIGGGDARASQTGDTA